MAVEMGSEACCTMDQKTVSIEFRRQVIYAFLNAVRIYYFSYDIFLRIILTAPSKVTPFLVLHCKESPPPSSPPQKIKSGVKGLWGLTNLLGGS
jgi:hypothetical protein